MSINDLVWKTTSDMVTIYDPLTVNAVTQITVQNYGSEDLNDLGFYIRPSSNLGDVDHPADFGPETDYQDLLTWGSRTVAALDTQGGVKVVHPVNDGPNETHYCTRTAGSLVINKISIADIAAGASIDFTVEVEAATGAPSRRFFVDFCME